MESLQAYDILYENACKSRSLSELVGSSVVDALGLSNQIVNCTRHFFLGRVIQIKSALNSEGIASHNSRLSSSAFTDDKRSSGVGTLNSLVVVNNIISTITHSLDLTTNYLPQSVAGRRRLTQNETQFAYASFSQVVHIYFNYSFLEIKSTR